MKQLFNGLVALAIGLSCAVAGAAPTTTWTLSAAGYISEGFDYSGLFGVANRDLRGLAFREVITASVNPSEWSFDNNMFPNERTISGPGPSFTVQVNVGGAISTFTSKFSDQYSYQALTNGYSQTQLWSEFDSYGSGQQGRIGNGEVAASIEVSGWKEAFVPTLDFGQIIPLYNIMNNNGVATREINASSSFAINGANSAHFYSNIIVSTTVNVVDRLQPVPVPVPEPEAYFMLLAGLGLVGAFASGRRL